MIDLINDNKHFTDENFTDINFSNNQVPNKEFYNCCFKSCDFNGVSFINCEFNDCLFIECNLNNLDVNNSKFSSVEFRQCKMVGIDWTTAYWQGLLLSTPLTFKECMINSSSFYGVSLEKIIIERCRAHDVDFREANLLGINFSHTDLQE